MAKRITKKFLSAINESNQAKTKPYDTTATVLRVEGRTAWVHIDGGADETPVQLTIDAKPGDTVRVRVSGGQAWLTGNGSAPPTDDTTAVKAEVKAEKADVLAQLAKKTADQAGKTATNYLFWSAEYGLIVSEDATENPEEMTGGSTRVTYDGVEMYKGQTRVAKFGQNNIIGEDTQSRVLIDPDSIGMVNQYDIDMFNIDMDGSEKTFSISYFDQADVSAYEGQSHSHDFTIQFSHGWDDGTGLSLWFYAKKGNGSDVVLPSIFNIQKGTASSGTSGTASYSYDGENDITVTRTIVTDEAKWQIAGAVSVTSNTSVLTFGTRGSGEKGAFSATFGECLIASEDGQVVLGKYNDPDSHDGLLLAVGNGTGNGALRNNAFCVDNDGNAYADGDYYSGVDELELGTMILPAVLTTTGGELYFTIPTGRLFPSGTAVSSLRFNMNGRAGSSNGQGSYIIRGSSSGTDTALFWYGSTGGTTSFYNANNNQKSVTQSMWTVSMQGGTSILVRINGGENYFFSGNSTKDGYLNNQPVVLYLTNVTIEL